MHIEEHNHCFMQYFGVKTLSETLFFHAFKETGYGARPSMRATGRKLTSDEYELHDEEKMMEISMLKDVYDAILASIDGGKKFGGQCIRESVGHNHFVRGFLASKRLLGTV